jgi:hypothetical protein
LGQQSKGAAAVVDQVDGDPDDDVRPRCALAASRSRLMSGVVGMFDYIVNNTRSFALRFHLMGISWDSFWQTLDHQKMKFPSFLRWAFLFFMLPRRPLSVVLSFFGGSFDWSCLQVRLSVERG